MLVERCSFVPWISMVKINRHMPLHVIPHKDTHRWPKNRKWPIKIGHLEDQNKIGQTFVLYIYIILYISVIAARI